MAPIVKIEGAAELAKQFRAAGGMVRDLSGAHRAIARELLPDAKHEAPSRSGRLARAHRAKGTRSSASIAAGGARVPYAGVIHFGNPTKKTYPARSGASRATGTLGVIGPNPWLYRALKRNDDRIVELYEENVGQLLRAAGLL